MDDLICDGRFDARLVRENKSAKGIFITLEIAADDYFAAKLSDVRPGALLKIGYQEIVDVSVQPIEVKPEYRQHLAEAKREAAAHVKTLKDPKPKRAFADYPLSAQCAMTCDDPMFHAFLEHHTQESPITTEDEAASLVRHHCRVESRADLDRFPEAANAWRELYRHYQAYITDSKYAAVRR